MLNKLSAKRDQVNKILGAITQSSSKEKDLANMKDVLSKRAREYAFFTEYCKRLQFFCLHLNDLFVEGTYIHDSYYSKPHAFISFTELPALMMELKQDFDDEQISSLCVSDKNDKLTITRFKAARPLDAILIKFMSIFQTYSNDLFHKTWDHCKQQLIGVQLKLGDIVVKLWEKAVHDSSHFIESLRGRSISLPKVEVLLKNYSTDKNLMKDIRNLEAGICKCIGKPLPASEMWIKECVKRMYQYNALCQHAYAASAFLQLKKTLELTGDFSIVERLASEV